MSRGRGVSFIRQLVILQLTLLFLAIISTFAISHVFYKKVFLDQARSQLHQTVSSYGLLIKKDKFSIEHWCTIFKESAKFRITIMSPTGKVLCDTRVNASTLDNHSDRPEVAQARSSEFATSIRFSDTIKKDMLYGAAKFDDFILRAAMPLAGLNTAIYKIWGLVGLILLPIFIILSVVSIKFRYRKEVEEQDKLAKLRGDFVANISHEIKTPLTSLKGYIQLMMADIQGLDFDQQDFLKRININAQRIDDLFSDVLDLSMLQNEKSIFIEVLSCDELFNKILNRFEGVYAEKRIEVAMNFQATDFEGDGKLVEMIFSNLVDNAFKYNSTDGQIYIKNRIVDDKIQFSIRDTGMGISAESLDRVFERFFRDDSLRSSDIKGTGLGLALVKHAVQLHGGDVSIASVEGVGTTFFVEFPVTYES